MASKDKKVLKPSTSRNDRIRTLADLNRPSGHDSDSDSDAPQEYFTGGEKRTILCDNKKFLKAICQIISTDLNHSYYCRRFRNQDPTKRNDVDEIFSQARQLGAIQEPIEGFQSSSSSTSFTGTGRLLSGETVPAAASQQQPESIVHDIVFWRNGFTVNDGPLRRMDDPENVPFLASIMKSDCPKELEPADRRTLVNVRLARRDENWNEPERATVAFQGVGRTLGGSTAPSSSEPTFKFTTASSSAPPSAPEVVVDETKPSTSIQLRLADGSRMVARFNYHHTVGDIRAFIDASSPGGNGAYLLQTVGFPPKQLNDLNQTIEEACLANSVIIQKR